MRHLRSSKVSRQRFREGSGGLYGTYNLAVDFDGAVNDELPRLSRAAGKQSPEDGHIYPPLQRSVGHVHIWGLAAELLHVRLLPRQTLNLLDQVQIGLRLESWLSFVGRLAALMPGRDILEAGLVLAGTSARGLLGAVIVGHVDGIHVDDGQHAAVEHALPLALLDVLAMVGAGQCLCVPFLLEEGPGDVVGYCSLNLGQVVEVVLVPCLADFLLGGRAQVSRGVDDQWIDRWNRKTYGHHEAHRRWAG